MSDRVHDIAAALACAWVASRPDGLSSWEDPLPSQYELGRRLERIILAGHLPMFATRLRFVDVAGGRICVELRDILAMAHAAGLTDWRDSGSSTARVAIFSRRSAEEIAAREGFDMTALKVVGAELRL